MKHASRFLTSGIAALFLLSGCASSQRTGNAPGTGGMQTEVAAPRPSQIATDEAITVYASPTCGCCHEYIPYLEARGLDVKTESVTDVNSVKEEFGIPEAAWSCHTAVIGGYYVEGHVPIEAIAKLLKDEPKIDGIALPGMPSGSPGMSGEKTGPFEVVAITGDEIKPFMSV